MMMSTVPAAAGSALAAILPTVNSLVGERKRKPRSRTAARWAPRQMSVTSPPAFASRAPRYEPMPPAPITAMRIVATIATPRRNDAARTVAIHRARPGGRLGAGVSDEADPLDPRLSARRRHRVHRAQCREHDVRQSRSADRDREPARSRRDPRRRSRAALAARWLHALHGG